MTWQRCEVTQTERVTATQTWPSATGMPSSLYSDTGSVCASLKFGASVFLSTTSSQNGDTERWFVCVTCDCNQRQHRTALLGQRQSETG